MERKIANIFKIKGHPEMTPGNIQANEILEAAMTRCILGIKEVNLYGKYFKGKSSYDVYKAAGEYYIIISLKSLKLISLRKDILPEYKEMGVCFLKGHEQDVYEIFGQAAHTAAALRDQEIVMANTL